MKKILILLLICTCLTTIGFGLIAWKLYPCPCSHLSSRNRTTTGKLHSEYTVIILSRTGRVIDIRRCTK